MPQKLNTNTIQSNTHTLCQRALKLTSLLAQWSFNLFLLVLLILLWIRPPRTNIHKPLFQGIQYARHFTHSPRPLVIHTLTIQLKTPGLRFLLTPPDRKRAQLSLHARTASTFIQKFGPQIAINGGFFHPFSSKYPWNYRPRAGEWTSPKGLLISNGVTYSTKPPSPALCFTRLHQPSIHPTGCPKGTHDAIAGAPLLVYNGKVQPLKKRPFRVGHAPRTAVGLDFTAKTMWLVVVDGRQPFYSQGMTILEWARWMHKLGAHTAINLDGGGSSTMLMRDHSGTPRLLNCPIHTRIPMRQRPVSNHLGVFANPLLSPPPHKHK